MNRKRECNVWANRIGPWVETAILVLLLIPMLSTLQVTSVYGLYESSMIVTVSDEKFHIEIDLGIQLTIDDYSQFVDAEDAYSRDSATFRGKLRESIEDGVRKLVSGAIVTNLDIATVDCHEDSGKMYVGLSFDVEGAITTPTNEGEEYNLKWRSFKADKKFSCEYRTIDPSESLGLDFSGFEDNLDNSNAWSIEEKNGDTIIKQRLEYELDVDDGEVDLRVTQKFTVPDTGLTVDNDTAQHPQAQQTTQQGTEQEQPKIPGFPWEGIVTALVLATVAIILQRTRKIPYKGGNLRAHITVPEHHY